jgi:hypothetical protein
MNRIAALSALALLAALLLPGQAAASPKLCRNTYGGDVILARKMPCVKARQVVRAWARGYKRSGTINGEARGFRCHGVHSPIEGLIVLCHKGKKRLSFYANVP